MADWNAELYKKFENERTRPARELLARILLPAPKNVVDLGCGPGNSTELLFEQYKGAAILGMDNSENMLVDARKRLPDCLFAFADIASWRPEIPARSDLCQCLAAMGSRPRTVVSASFR